ncbi:MAG: hypothetical protein EHM28_11630 [Spirochaetaceae bacterium]|nr:MAG: hypothetical protein EHM28_11630 [Spirochaetaceae bacterium]
MKITAKDLYHFKIIDEIIEEPAGGAHKDPTQTASNIKASILRSLEALTVKPRDQLLRDRFDKFRDMGLYVEKKSEKKKNLLQRIFSK